MQQEKYKNPFESITKLSRVEFDTKFKHVALLELIFEELAVATSCYEIFSNSIDAEPEDLWKFVCYFQEEPKLEELQTALEGYLESEISIYLEQEEDWVSVVQKDAKPVIAGKFYVSGSSLINNAPAWLIPIKIDAGRAFGTGEHATTKGCLEMISGLDLIPRKILDVGTGTGVLAISCYKLWPDALIDATDIDEIAVTIAAENASENKANINFGLSYNLDSNKENYDIIISNILAAPLIEMAEDFIAMLKPKGYLVISGFIEKQTAELIDLYERLGLSFKKTLAIEDWRIVLFTKK